jgi:hypothetical protein
MESEHTNTPREPEQTNVASELENTAIAPETPLLAPVPFYHRKSFWITAVLIIVVLGGLYFASSRNVFIPAVAEVNGMKITKAEFDESLALIHQSAALQGVNLEDIATEDVVRDQALEVLINNALLITAAKSEGISASKGEIDEKYSELVAEVGDTDVFAAKMQEVGLTEEKLRKNIEDRILADKYIESVTDIEDVTISDDEILEFYNSIPDDGREIPPLEDVKTDLGTGLKLQKQQQILESVLEDLRNSATIELHI